MTTISDLYRSSAIVVLATLVLAGCAAPAAATRPGTSPNPGSGQVVVFAAASLADAFRQIATAFTATNPGIDVVVNAGGSPGLASAIVAGAPADVFAAASPATMSLVRDAGLIAGSPAVFARSAVQIAVPAGNPGGITGIVDFADPARKIALCAPQVPCGEAAARVFAAAGITAAPDTLELDVTAAITKVRLGEVDAAIVYRTDVLAAGSAVLGIDIPGGPVGNDYLIARLSSAPNREGATAFVDFVLGDTARSILSADGFSLG